MKKTILASIIIFFSIIIQAQEIINIPDSFFKDALIQKGIDTDGDNEISKLEALDVLSLSLTSLTITNLSGIEEFKNLEELWCEETEITILDLSKNEELLQLTCSNCLLQKLDVSNTKITELDCHDNNITDIKLNNSMKILYCSSNNISDIDISICPNLEELDLAKNQISNIDISNNHEFLKILNISNNLISDIDIQKNTKLTTLICNNTNLENIDVSKNNELWGIDCSNNSFYSLDVSNNPKIEILLCNSNNLNSLDLTNNTNLTKLNCSDNIELSKVCVVNVSEAENNENFLKDDATIWTTDCNSLNNKIFNEKIDVRIFPIPAKRYINIISNEKVLGSISNMNGEILKSNMNIAKGDNKLNLDLPPQIYILELVGEKTTIVKQIIIE